MSRALLAALALALAPAAQAQAQSDPVSRFRAANEAARGGDYPAAIAGYRELAAEGHLPGCER